MALYTIFSYKTRRLKAVWPEIVFVKFQPEHPHNHKGLKLVHQFVKQEMLNPEDMDSEFQLAISGVGNDDWSLAHVVENYLGPVSELAPPHTPVEASTEIGTGHSSAQFITNQGSALFSPKNDIINPRTAWSSRPEHNQFSAPTVYESQYDLQPPLFVPTPTNPYAHQHGSTPLYPEPAAPSVPPMYSDYHPPPSPHVTTTYNIFGSGCSVPPTTYQIIDYHPQTMMTNGHGQQGISSMQLTGSQSVPEQMNDYNQLLNTQTTEGLSSQVFSSRAPETERPLRLERGPVIKKHQVASASANQAATQRGKRKAPESSTTRGEVPEEIRRILNMKPRRSISFNCLSTTPQQNQSLYLPKRRMDINWKDYLVKPQDRNKPDATPVMLTVGEGRYESRRRGRLPNPVSFPLVSSSTPQKQFSNSLYDPAFATNGDPADPHFRSFKAQPEK